MVVQLEQAGSVKLLFIQFFGGLEARADLAADAVAHINVGELLEIRNMPHGQNLAAVKLQSTRQVVDIEREMIDVLPQRPSVAWNCPVERSFQCTSDSLHMEACCE